MITFRVCFYSNIILMIGWLLLVCVFTEKRLDVWWILNTRGAITWELCRLCLRRFCCILQWNYSVLKYRNGPVSYLKSQFFILYMIKDQSNQGQSKSNIMSTCTYVHFTSELSNPLNLGLDVWLTSDLIGRFEIKPDVQRQCVPFSKIFYERDLETRRLYW